MDKLEALKITYPDAEIEQLDDISFVIDGTHFSVYSDDELEIEAKEDIKETFEDCYTEEGLSYWVKENGGIDNFYNDVWLNDFRLEDSESFGDMDDEELLDELRDMGYFDFITIDMLDMDKMADYVWDIDGAQVLSRVDGNIDYANGYSVIRED